MAKFSGTVRTAPPLGPTVTTGPAWTHEGGTGFAEDVKTQLYTLAVTNMVSETTFYESAGDRDGRFRQLIHQATAEDPTWVAGFVPWLRNEANMRSAAAVMACEYVAAGGPHGRAVIASACARADEPAEVLGYWLATHARHLPQPIKRGVADAAVRLYNQATALKYDGASRGLRMGDVLELAHPKAVDDLQNALFRHLIDRRHGRDGLRDAARSTGLIRLAEAYDLDAIPVERRRAVLRERGATALADAGYTWERLSGWLPGGMDAEAWEAIIPAMGYMALLRNLRNFENAGVSRATLDAVAARIADPDQVARSRQFPYRFWSAYRNSGTIRLGPALEDALEHSTANVPAFTGRTLIMVDTSGSMQNPVSTRSAVQMVEIGALFAAAVAAHNEVALCPYASDTYRSDVQRSVLRTIEDINRQIGRVGHGTNTWPCTMAAWREYGPFDRIVVFTDMQDHPARVTDLPDVPVYVWDLRGYGTASVDTRTRGRYLFSGFTDAAFRLISLLEKGKDAGWPWV